MGGEILLGKLVGVTHNRDSTSTMLLAWLATIEEGTRMVVPVLCLAALGLLSWVILLKIELEHVKGELASKGCGGRGSGRHPGGENTSSKGMRRYHLD